MRDRGVSWLYVAMAVSRDFDAWYRELHPRLVTVLAGVVGDTDLACDAADEALARALEKWTVVADMASPDGWTYRVALNLVRRRQSRLAMERRLLLTRGPAQTVDGPSGEIWVLVSALGVRQREAVLLRHVAGMTEPEIAAAMGVARGTVNSTLRASYLRLKEALEPDPPPAPAGGQDGTH